MPRVEKAEEMQKLSEFAPWCEDNNDSSDFVMLYDNNSGSGEFVVVYSLLKQLKCGVSVHLLCFNHERSHYESILRKNNLDANRLEAAGKLKISCVVSDNSEILELSNNSTWSSVVYTLNQPTNDRIAVLVDDVDAMELVSPSSHATRSFVSSLLSRMYSNDSIVSVTAFGRLPMETVSQFNSLSSGDGSRFKPPSGQSITAASRYNCPLDENEEPSLSEYLKYRSDVTVIVSPLESGYSSAIHGIITVIRHHSQTAGRRQTNLQYKALDSGVVCSLVGGSG